MLQLAQVGFQLGDLGFQLGDYPHWKNLRVINLILYDQFRSFEILLCRKSISKKASLPCIILCRNAPKRGFHAPRTVCFLNWSYPMLRTGQNSSNFLDRRVPPFNGFQICPMNYTLRNSHSPSKTGFARRVSYGITFFSAPMLNPKDVLNCCTLCSLPRKW